MEEKTALNLMVPIEKYPHIKHWTTLHEAVETIEKAALESHGRQSLPRALLVVDDKYNLLGIVRRRDIMRGLEPKFLQNIPIDYQKKVLFEEELDPNLVEMSFAGVEEIFQERAERPVSKVMMPIVATANHNDHLAKIVFTMVSRNLALLPVMKGKKVIGVVRSVDVFHEIAELLRHSKRES
jgi:predicted transcriptional regulator